MGDLISFVVIYRKWRLTTTPCPSSKFKWLPNFVDSSMAQKLYKKTMRRMVVPVIVGNQQCVEVDGTQE